MRIFKSKLFITILIFILTFGGIAGGVTAVNSISGNENVYADEDYSFSKFSENIVKLFNKDTAPSSITGEGTTATTTGTSVSDSTEVSASMAEGYSKFTEGIKEADTTRVGNFGAFFGYAREGIVMWLTSLIAMGKVTFSYDQLASVTGADIEVTVKDSVDESGVDTNPFWFYSQYGKVLKDMGLDQNRSSGIVGALLMFVKLIGGVFLLLVYLFSMLVPAVFSLVATFLRYFNPFTFMVSIPGIYEVYQAFYSFGRWIAAPLFLALMFVGIYVFGPKGANIHGDQASFSSKMFKFIKRFAFIIIGIPLIGLLYTIAINNLAENLGNMGTGFADKMLARSMIDFGQWASQERLALPGYGKGGGKGIAVGLEVEVDNTKNKTRLAPTLNSLNAVRQYTYYINKQTNSVGQTGDPPVWQVTAKDLNAVTKYQSETGDANDQAAVQKIEGEGSWDTIVKKQEQASFDDDKQRGSTGLEAILGYMLSNVYTAQAFESDTKGELQAYIRDHSENGKPNAEGKAVADVLAWYAEDFKKIDGKLYELFRMNQYDDWSNNIMLNGGLEMDIIGDKLYFKNVNTQPTGSGDTVETAKDGLGNTTIRDSGEGKYSVMEFKGLSSMSMYNYLSTNFGSDSMDVYASADSSSDFVKEEHLSVHMVGQTFLHRALLLFQAIVMLLCMTIIGLVYGFAVLFANIKRGFQIIFNMPFMLVGSLQAAAKVVIYTVVLFLEVFGTMFLYSVVENMFGAVMDVSMQMLEDTGSNMEETLKERDELTRGNLPLLMRLRSGWVNNYYASASNVELDSGYTYSDTSGLVANTDIEADLTDISTNSLDDAYAYAATGTSYAQNGVAIKLLFGPIVTIVVGIIFTVISIKYRKVIVQSLEEMIANVIQKLVVGSGSAPPVTGGSGGGMGKALLGGAAAGAAGVLARAAGGGGKGGDKAGDNAGNVEEANSKAAAKAEDSKDGGGKGSKGSGEKQIQGRVGSAHPAAGKSGVSGVGGGITDKQASEDAAGGGNGGEDESPDKKDSEGRVNAEADSRVGNSLSPTAQKGQELAKQKGDLATGSGNGEGGDKKGSEASASSEKKANASNDKTDSANKTLDTDTTETNAKGSTTATEASEIPEEQADGAPGADEANGTLAANEDPGALGQGQDDQDALNSETPAEEAAADQTKQGIDSDDDPAGRNDSASENPADNADGANKADGADGDTSENKELAKDDKEGENGTPEKGKSKQGFTDKALDKLAHPVKTAADIGKGIAAGATAALGGAAGVEAIKNAKGLGGKLAATAKGLKQGIPSAIANSAAGRYANNVANQAKAVNKSANDVKKAANDRRSAIGDAGNAKKEMRDALKTGGKNSPEYKAAKDKYDDAKTRARDASKKALTGAFATAGNAIKVAGKAMAPAAKVAGDMAKAGMQVGAGAMVAGIGAYSGNIGLIAHGTRIGMDGIGLNQGRFREAVDNAADRVSFAQAAFGAGISGTSMGDIYNSYQNMQATGGLEQRTQNTDHGSGGINHSSGGTTTGGNTYMQPGVSHDAVTNNSPPIQPQAPVGQTTQSRTTTSRGRK